MPSDPHSDSPALVGTVERCAVVRMGPHLLFHLPATDDRMGNAGGHPVALLAHVHQAEFHGIETKLFRQFIYHRLYGKAGLRLA